VESLSGRDAVNCGQLHDLLVDERTVLNAIEGVLALIDFEASLGGRGKRLGEALSHHVVVLSRARLKTCTSCLAEGLATELEVLFCNLPVVQDNVDCDVGLVWELGDVLSAGVPPHDVAAVLESLDESNGGRWGHGESIIVDKFITTLFINGLP